jgi:acyl-CoA synthetase (AMP-forming)/AMP-acid ligase II
LTETSSTIAILGPEEHRQSLASSDAAVRARLSSVGRLVPGIEAQIRDEGGKVLPGGMAGSLWVRGRQVSGEYMGQGSILDSSGWFPTRDRAWIDADGFLFVGGRMDDTIIRGGENVAPAEIEDVLVQHPAVQEVAVVGLPDQEWGERIAAFVVVRASSQSVTGQALRDWTRQRLRSSRTPDEILFVDELPRTALGKVLRRELVAQYMRRPEQASPTRPVGASSSMQQPRAPIRASLSSRRGRRRR